MTESTDDTTGQTPQPWLARPLASLSYPHFRLFWLSNLVVAMGLMVQFTARGWLIVDLTKSAFLLGAVDAAWALAAGLGSIPMGVVADRVNRRNLLAVGNVVILGSALVIGKVPGREGLIRRRRVLTNRTEVDCPHLLHRV